MLGLFCMNPFFISPTWANNQNQLVCIQTTRMGGESLREFYSLNLGLSSGDKKEIVLRNRQLIFNQLNIPSTKVCLAQQTHSDNILITHSAGVFENYDAIIVTKPGIFAAISIADCTPVILMDLKTKVAAAIHAGWRGTAQNISYKTLQCMIKLGCSPHNIKAFIGACISYNSFEVGPEVADQFNPTFIKKHQNEGKFLIDLKGLNKKQLTDLGLLTENIEISEYCTFNQNDLFYSYRKEKGTTGRMMAITGFR